MSRFSCTVLVAASMACAMAQTRPTLPRLADGKPNFQGIWRANSRAAYGVEDHAARLGMPGGRGVVEGGAIPYQPAALAKRDENFKNRATADPLGHCYIPGVPRMMYLDFNFQIFQTAQHIGMTFEWTQMHRLVYLNGKAPLHGSVESWMGDSRGRWDGDTLVVTVTDQNDKSWFDMAGNHHSDAMKVTERYTLVDADTIQYEATIEDPKTFTRPWKLSVPLERQKRVDRLMEYQCQAEVEESNGAFERDSRLWYPDAGLRASGVPASVAALPAPAPRPDPAIGANIARLPNGKPDLNGYYMADAGGANYGLEKHGRDALTPGTRGVVVDPADGMLPARDWARAERVDRELPHRGYDDPTAHCFVAGVPRSMYVPSPHQIIQTDDYVAILFERMSWRVIPLNGRAHIADSIRLWQGDSVGHWEGDVLVVDTANLNGKPWLNEVGEVMSHAARVVERFVPVDRNKLLYRATVSDPIAYSKPWTIEMAINREEEELLEVACLEDNNDLSHLKDVRDEFRAKQGANKAGK
jgi:hypothetical protein